MILEPKELEQISRMIAAHTREAGAAPYSVQLALPKNLKVQGVRIEFYVGNQPYTCGHEKVIHHTFLEHEK